MIFSQRHRNSQLTARLTFGIDCMTMTRQRKMVSIRPSPQDDKILTALAAKLGVNASAVIRLGLRLLAEKEGVKA